MFILLLCAIISFILYLSAPEAYSYTFSIVCLVNFLLSSFVMLKSNCRQTLVKFEFFFLFAFFFTNIVYAVVYYPVNPYFFLFNLEFNEDYINKGLALSVLAVNVFNIGVFDKKGHVVDKSNFRQTHYYEPRTFVYLLMCMYLPLLIVAALSNAYVVDFTRSNINAILVFVFYYIIYAVFANNSNTVSIKSFLKKSHSLLLFIVIGLYILLFLYIGSRTIPLRLILLIFFLYVIYVQNIGKKYVVGLLICGGILMMAVSVFRARGEFDTSTLTSFWDIGMDLTINNRSLYVLMEEADLHGFTWGKSLLSSVAATIPWGQSILLEITGWKFADINSATFVTDLYFSGLSGNVETYGLGTNMIGDLYYAFGVPGVLLYMYFLGHIMKKLYSGISKGNHIYVFYYAMIFVEVIYITRASSLEFCRNLVWGMIWFYIFNKIMRKQKI